MYMSNPSTGCAQNTKHSSLLVEKSGHGWLVLTFAIMDDRNRIFGAP